MTRRLTGAQHELLYEMDQSSTGGLWIYPGNRRTAEALARDGYARVSDVYTDRHVAASFYEVTDIGHAALAGDGR